MSKSIDRQAKGEAQAHMNDAFEMKSQLSQWPVQIKLAPVNAPYFDGS